MNNIHIQESDVPKVTPKELTIITDVAAGLSCKQIAAKYGISVKTVTVHRSNIIRKTGYSNMTKVVAEYLRSRIIA